MPRNQNQFSGAFQGQNQAQHQVQNQIQQIQNQGFQNQQHFQPPAINYGQNPGINQFYPGLPAPPMQNQYQFQPQVQYQSQIQNQPLGSVFDNQFQPQQQYQQFQQPPPQQQFQSQQHQQQQFQAREQTPRQPEVQFQQNADAKPQRQNKNKNHHSNSSVFQTSQNSGQYQTSSQAAQSAAPVHNPAAGSYQFGVSDRKVISTGNAYGDELQRQVAEKKERTAAEKRKRDREDAKVEDYDPFGRGGAGAPLKTASGSVVADLRKLHKLNEVVGDDPTISKAQREDQLNSNFDESYGSKKNFSYRDYLEEQIQIKNKKKEASKKAKEDEEMKDRDRITKQMQQIKDEHNQELLAEQRKNDEKEKEKNAKFAAIENAAKSAENSKKDVIRQKREQGKREVAERMKYEQGTQGYGYDQMDDRPLDNAEQKTQASEFRPAREIPRPAPVARAPVQNYQNQQNNQGLQNNQNQQNLQNQLQNSQNFQKPPSRGNPVPSSGPYQNPSIPNQSQIRYYQSQRQNMQSRDSMMDVTQKRHEVGRELNALKKQLLAEKDKVEQQITNASHFKLRNMNSYRLPTRDYINRPVSNRVQNRGYSGYAPAPNVSGGLPGTGLPPRFAKQGTQVSLLNADTKFMPVGDLDFGVPGGSVTAGDNYRGFSKNIW